MAAQNKLRRTSLDLPDEVLELVRALPKKGMIVNTSCRVSYWRLEFDGENDMILAVTPITFASRE